MTGTGRVLILGGGFGGVAAASRLSERLGQEHEIVLVDRGTHFMMGFRKTAAVIGREDMESGSRALADLERKGIRVQRGSITRIDPAAHAADVDGRTIEADALLVALGAETVPGAVPGLVEHGINVYDRAGVPAARDALARARNERVVVGIFGAPYKCPPAPYELAILVDESIRARGGRPKVTAFTPQPMSLPVLGKGGCEAIEDRMVGLGIEFRPNSKPQRVEAGRVVLAEDGEVPFDVLLAVPPHRCPPVVVEAGLAEAGGWIKVNPRTMETGVDGVWAVGDNVGIKMANDQPMPKAGVFAEAAGEVAAEGIAARLQGRTSDATFAGEGFCFLEVGDGEAMYVRGNFLAQPAPEVELTPPSKESLAEKARFERSRLEAWFGPKP